MSNVRSVKMKLVFETPKYPYFLDVSSLFYDLELLHDLFLLLYVKDYHNYRFSQYFWYRHGRQLKDEHRLRVFRIINKSPLIVELILSIVVVSSRAIWPIVQSLEEISKFKLNREKSRLEIKKLEREIELLNYKIEREKIETEKALKEKECLTIFNSLLKRIENNQIKLKDIELSSMESDNEESDNENGR